MDTTLVDLAPLARLALLAVVAAMLPIAYVWVRSRNASLRSRLATLTAVTLFLTFDLIVFGSFTRLSDSGLGCPDWPGCYGAASPIGAQADIAAAERALPTGPVTWGKAWIEMIHRYLAMTVGVLILVMAGVSVAERRNLPHSPWLPVATLGWVMVQGLFGKYTVTLKLYPAIVTLHLLGGLFLLALLAVQHEAFRDQRLVVAARLRRLVMAALLALALQVAFGGWVSTNYAVLACPDFPLCHGQWLPSADFATGFTLLRELGETASGSMLSVDALVAIHLVHRWFAVVACIVLLWTASALLRSGQSPLRGYGIALATLTLAQVASGLSNVILGWPIVAALVHSAGAAGLVLTLALLLARTRPARLLAG